MNKHRQICQGSTQTCDICSEVFSGYDTLRKHFKKSHPEDERYKQPTLQKQTCERCGKVFKSMSSLKQHMERAHDEGHIAPEDCFKKCPTCEYLTKKSSLNASFVMPFGFHICP